MDQNFGGNWTESKMDIVVAYAKSYLTIMNKQSWAKTLYFDGFAGSGTVGVDVNDETIKGTALRILDINEPKPFDLYYFVEKEEEYAEALKSKVQIDHPDKTEKIKIVQGDCNKKLIDMANFLRNNRNFRALAFIDPYGMTVNWSSIESLKELGIDLWILVPTGVGVNRLLVNDGNINESWLIKLEQFLGVGRDYIKKQFYTTLNQATLFGEETIVKKETDAINKIGKLYTERLKTVFELVSDSFVMKNSTNSIMYHFMMATNNKNALKIANDVIKPKYKM